MTAESLSLQASRVVRRRYRFYDGENFSLTIIRNGTQGDLTLSIASRREGEREDPEAKVQAKVVNDVAELSAADLEPITEGARYFFTLWNTTTNLVVAEGQIVKARAIRNTTILSADAGGGGGDNDIGEAFSGDRIQIIATILSTATGEASNPTGTVTAFARLGDEVVSASVSVSGNEVTVTFPETLVTVGVWTVAIVETIDGFPQTLFSGTLLIKEAVVAPPPDPVDPPDPPAAVWLIEGDTIVTAPAPLPSPVVSGIQITG